MPTRDRAELLARALDSVVGATASVAEHVEVLYRMDRPTKPALGWSNTASPAGPAATDTFPTGRR
jgi:hypothetical protein